MRQKQTLITRQGQSHASASITRQPVEPPQMTLHHLASSGISAPRTDGAATGLHLEKSLKHMTTVLSKVLKREFKENYTYNRSMKRRSAGEKPS